MTDAERLDENAARLLAGQLDDLARFRHIVEAQRAVLRMGAAGMLEVFSREADGIASDISARENHLLAVRAAAQPPVGEAGQRIAALDAQVAAARAAALADVSALSQDMERQASGIAQSIRSTTAELERLVNGYGRPIVEGRPFLVDRTG